MKWTTKDKQDAKLRGFVENQLESFKDSKPTKTIGNHHYIRQRNLEQFMYDFAITLLVQSQNYMNALETKVTNNP